MENHPQNGVGSANGSRSLADKPLRLGDGCILYRQTNTDTGHDAIISSLHPYGSDL